MIFTLAWKEVREHQGVWLTMLVTTIMLGSGLSRLVAAGDASLAAPVAAFTIFGLTAAYGVVCGAMMFAGEHEGGTLVFLDIFLGRRDLLWAGKFVIGVVLALTEALAAASILYLLRQDPPAWAMGLFGFSAGEMRVFWSTADPGLWFVVLPVVALEAYAWGLLGSSLSKRVLAGAAMAAVGFTPVWLFAICAASPVFFSVRIAIVVVLLVISLATFVNQPQDDAISRPPEPETALDPKLRILERWNDIDEGDDFAEGRVGDDAPADEPVVFPSVANHWARERPLPIEPVPRSREPELVEAESPGEVLWWLTFAQAWPLLWAIGGVCFLFGFIIVSNSQVLWPLATLLLGIACGTAAFAPEQRDLSYQFLSAQHFPLKTIWRFKLSFWLAVAVLGAVVMLLGCLLVMVPFGRDLPRAPGQRINFVTGFGGTLRNQMGWGLFFGIWLIYGFCTSQLVVWYCRKNILALLVSCLTAASFLGIWLASLLCGGMSGWQVWITPLTMLLATWFLMRAWAAGRIMERKPLTALAGFGAGMTLWLLCNFGYRAWEIPDVGAPLDIDAFRATLPADKANNPAGAAIQEALVKFAEAKPAVIVVQVPIVVIDEAWHAPLTEAARLPVGVIELPRADGQAALLKDLPMIRRMMDELLGRARAKEQGPAFDHLAQVLALSRNLRNKAPLTSYLAGVQAENDALDELDAWLGQVQFFDKAGRGKPSPLLLRHVADEMDRHARETPAPLDCMQTECYRSSGFLDNPSTWSFASRDPAVLVRERSLAGAIALSLETPWEAERKTRLWQLVWAGLFRALETPHWKLPPPGEDLPAQKIATQTILRRWLPAEEGPGAGISRAEMCRLLDTSWLADDRLFCPVAPLRNAATRARWRVDATRLAIALCLYRMDEGQPAQDLQKLVPKYFPAGLPIDPYSGEPYRYRVEPGVLKGERIFQEIVWSTGPDGIDDGGHKHGGNLPDDDTRWLPSQFDLIKAAPHWR